MKKIDFLSLAADWQEKVSNIFDTNFDYIYQLDWATSPQIFATFDSDGKLLNICAWGYLTDGSLEYRYIYLRKLQLLDVCFPDYFLGHSAEVIAVPVSGKVTVGQMRELLISEVNSYESSYATDEVKQTFNKGYGTFDDNDVFVEVEEYDDDFTIYAYFVIV